MKKEQADRIITKYLQKIYGAMGDKPCYTTNYFRFNENNGVYTDDKLTDELFVALENGAKLIDIRGDLFDANDVELTEKPEAVAKQKEVIILLCTKVGSLKMKL